MRTPYLAALAAVLFLSSCSSTEEAPAPAASAAPPEAATIDRTAELQAANPDAAWSVLVTTATETEPGRVEVATSITDPRGEAGSPEAQQALDVCAGTVALLGESAVRVTVLEADGTTFAIYSTEALPADLPSSECVEY